MDHVHNHRAGLRRLETHLVGHFPTNALANPLGSTSGTPLVSCQSQVANDSHDEHLTVPLGAPRLSCVWWSSTGDSPQWLLTTPYLSRLRRSGSGISPYDTALRRLSHSHRRCRVAPRTENVLKATVSALVVPCHVGFYEPWMGRKRLTCRARLACPTVR